MDGVGPYTQRMAAYAASYLYEDLPERAIDIARQIILHTIGAILLGSRPGYTSVRVLGDMAIQEAGSGGSTVFGRDAKGSLLGALLANGTMGYAADAEGGGASVHFVPTVHQMVPYSTGYRMDDLSVTLDVAAKIVTLPMYPDMTDDDVGYVCDAIRRFFHSTA